MGEPMDTPAPWTRWRPNGDWFHWAHGDQEGRPFKNRRRDTIDWRQHGTLTATPRPGGPVATFIGITSEDALAMADDRGYTLTEAPILAAQEPGQ